MKEYRGHMLPDDLYYLILSYVDRVDWFAMHDLLEPADHPYMLKPTEKLTREEMKMLVDDAIKYNTDQIEYGDA